MKKILLISIMLLILAFPLASMSFYMGGNAGAAFNFYMPFDCLSWGSGFYGMAHFPLGGNIMFDFDPIPFALALGGGYYPYIEVGIDPIPNHSPFYAEIIGYYTDNEIDDEKVKTFSGGGIGVYFGEFPVLDILAENKVMWFPAKHFYLSLGTRIDFTLDIGRTGSGLALGFLQAGLGLNAGLGVAF